MEGLNHIGIILDGNRRYAKSLAWKPWKGHEKGAEVVEQLLDWAKEFDIKELTLYTFSLENFKRPDDEKNFLFEVIEKFLKKYEKDKRVDENKVKIQFIGLLDRFPKGLQEVMHRLMNKTKKYGNYILNFAMGYTGRQEIIDAAKKLAEKVKNGLLRPEDITEESFKKELYLEDEPDLIIRTGGVERLSGFLPFQSTYSELYFSKKLWPEFTKQDLKAAIEDFHARKRNFGK